MKRETKELLYLICYFGTLLCAALVLGHVAGVWVLV